MLSQPFAIPAVCCPCCLLSLPFIVPMFIVPAICFHHLLSPHSLSLCSSSLFLLFIISISCCSLFQFPAVQLSLLFFILCCCCFLQFISLVPPICHRCHSSSAAPPYPPMSSGSQAGWWCCVTWHLCVIVVQRQGLWQPCEQGLTVAA